MRVITTFKRVPSTSAYGDGIQIIQTIYSTSEEIEQIEKMCKENIGTALINEAINESNNSD